MATKKNTKKFIADITVDLTNATSARDVYAAFAEAKIEKNCSCIEKEAYASMIADSINPTIVCVYSCDKCPMCKEKKPNIFKRFWNWLKK